MGILITLITCIISAVLYRLGGIGGIFKTWMRDWIIPILAYSLLFYLKTPTNLLGWLMIIPAIALTGGALTTYWDDLFGGVDNFYMHGAMVGLAAFPFIWSGVHWWMILIRLIVLGGTMGALNIWINKTKIPAKDWIEELFRGFIILATIPLLLL